MVKINLTEIGMGVGAYPVIAFAVELESPAPFEEVHILSFICRAELAEESPVFLGYAYPRVYPTIFEKTFFGIDFELDHRKIAKIEERKKGEDVWLRLSGSVKFAFLLERKGEEFKNIKIVDEDFTIQQHGVSKIRIEKERWEDFLSFLNIRKKLIISERVLNKLNKAREIINPKLEDEELIEELLEMYLRGK